MGREGAKMASIGRLSAAQIQLALVLAWREDIIPPPGTCSAFSNSNKAIPCYERYVQEKEKGGRGMCVHGYARIPFFSPFKVALKLRRTIEGGISTRSFLSSCLIKGAGCWVSMFVSACSKHDEKMVAGWRDGGGGRGLLPDETVKLRIGLKYFPLIHLYLIHFCWEMRLI